MTILITGCAGFIGANLSTRLIKAGERVIGLDNLSRRGSTLNLESLRTLGLAKFVQADVADRDAVGRLFDGESFKAVYHLAGQTAVTTSVADPRGDFIANAVGTLNVLEAVRRKQPTCLVVYASTNKVYGGLGSVAIAEGDDQYGYADLPHGIDEKTPLDFHSPYGCSKGAGDQYVRDYCRIYRIPTVVCRQSCIYGPRQFGLESQGWLAWLTMRLIEHEPVRIYGDGKQVRDVLYIDDLIDFYLRLLERADRVAGEVFNVGGGPAHTLSLRQLIARVQPKVGGKADVTYRDWRPGDQRVFISDIRKARQLLDWSPRTSVDDGVSRLYDWLVEHRAALKRLPRDGDAS